MLSKNSFQIALNPARELIPNSPTIRELIPNSSSCYYRFHLKQ